MCESQEKVRRVLSISSTGACLKESTRIGSWVLLVSVPICEPHSENLGKGKWGVAWDKELEFCFFLTVSQTIWWKKTPQKTKRTKQWVFNTLTSVKLKESATTPTKCKTFPVCSWILSAQGKQVWLGKQSCKRTCVGFFELDRSLNNGKWQVVRLVFTTLKCDRDSNLSRLSFH